MTTRPASAHSRLSFAVSAGEGPARSEYLNAREAAARLGVKPRTLYAYVARGLLRSEPVPEDSTRTGTSRTRGTARRYVARDVEAMLEKRRQRSPDGAARSAIFGGLPVVESSIGCIEGGLLLYRGRDATELAAGASFEQVAELLWTGVIPDERRFVPSPDRLPADILRELRGIAAGEPPLVRLPFLASLVATFDPRRRETTRAALLSTARRAVVRLVAALAKPDADERDDSGRADAGVAAALFSALSGRAPREEETRAMDQVLVLSAEHELNASTFTARVAASAGADPYAVLTAALATLSGPKHGGVCERVEALVAEVSRPSRALRVLARRGNDVPGFGHMLYPGGDPRAAPLLATAAALASGRPNRDLDVVFAIVRAMAAERDARPTLDIALVSIAVALRLPSGSAAALFAVGRMAGWIAHALEQRELGSLIRPRARYVGSREGAS